MATTIVNKCRPTDVKSNTWCLKTMFSLGEGADLVFLPVAVWGQIKKRWFITQASEESNAPMILAEEAGSTQMSYIYNEPVITSPKTVLETLFPDASAADAEKFGLYFAGNNLIFNPTLGNSIESNGVPYQTSAFSLPVGSDREYDALVQYLQANAWVGIKLSADAQTMHVYGGPRGYFPKADEVAEMLFSGNNDAKGETTAAFEVAKANYAIEYVTLGEQTVNKNALSDLMGYFKDGACKENGSEVVSA